MKKNILIKCLLVGVIGTIGAVAGIDNPDSDDFEAADTGFASTSTWHGNLAGEGGNYNTFIGARTGENTLAWRNTFIGAWAGKSTTDGAGNTFIGEMSGVMNTTGDNNLFLGEHTGDSMTIGSGNVLIGQRAGGDLIDNNNTLYIENSDSNTPLIYGEFDNDLVRVNGNMEVTFSGAGDESVYSLLKLTADDTDGTGPSEAAFVLRNEKAGLEWLFRTIDNGTAFTATLGGTGGAELKIVSDEGDYRKTKLYIGGVLVFANGKIQKAAIQP